jgi:hypothetical protein
VSRDWTIAVIKIKRSHRLSISVLLGFVNHWGSSP